MASFVFHGAVLLALCFAGISTKPEIISPPPMLLEVTSNDGESSLQEGSDSSDIAVVKETLGRAVGILNSFNHQQEDCSNDRGQRKLCPIALWKRIVSLGKSSLAPEDRAFFEKIQKHNRQAAAFARASVNWLHNKHRGLASQSTLPVEPGVLQQDEIEHYWKVLEQIESMGFKHLLALEKQSWLKWSRSRGN
ncbi:MAG TPA: hypothetical protein VJB59_08820 [Bdellovibrionota bacterium]|nr:hypothetical protein [Bdellovibrionota bacterium]